MDLATAVKTAMAAARITQQELAAAAGVNRTTVNEIVTGRIQRSRRPDVLQGLADALGIKLELLLSEDATEAEIRGAVRAAKGLPPYPDDPAFALVPPPGVGRVVTSPPPGLEGRIPVLPPDVLLGWDWEDFDFLKDKAVDSHLAVMPGSNAFFVVARGPELTGVIPPLEEGGAAVHITEGMLLQTIPKLRPPGRHPVIAHCEFGPALRMYVPYEEGGPYLIVLGAHQTPVQKAPHMFPMVAALHRFVRL